MTPWAGFARPCCFLFFVFLLFFFCGFFYRATFWGAFLGWARETNRPLKGKHTFKPPPLKFRRTHPGSLVFKETPPLFLRLFLDSCSSLVVCVCVCYSVGNRQDTNQMGVSQTVCCVCVCFSRELTGHQPVWRTDSYFKGTFGGAVF